MSIDTRLRTVPRSTNVTTQLVMQSQPVFTTLLLFPYGYALSS